MTKRVEAAAGDNPVEAAIAAGKILPSRRALYLEKLKKEPKRTTKLLASLEPIFTDGYEPEYPDGSPRDESAAPVRIQAAPPRPTASGPQYDPSWLRPGEVGAPVAGSITFEDAPARAAALAALGL
jgi:hypothetical protein